MTQRTVAGTSFGLVAGAPATEDVAGYGALVFVNVGELTNIGELGGTYTPVTTNNIADRIQKTVKGTYVPGTLTLTVGEDMTDVGQLLVETAYTSPDDNYSFELADQNGDKVYFQGLVTKFSVTRGGPDDVVTGNIEIAVNTELTVDRS